jgi:hypothetical protein
LEFELFFELGCGVGEDVDDDDDGAIVVVVGVDGEDGNDDSLEEPIEVMVLDDVLI